jgi:hypothetical protein
MNVELEVLYLNHTFQRIVYPIRPASGRSQGFLQAGESTEPVEYFTVSRPTDKLDYEDVSRVNVTMELAGGLCNTTLGNATVWFTRQAECGPDFKMVYNITKFSNIFQLPASRFDFEFGELRTNLPTFNLAVRDYLVRADNSTGEFDLRNISDSSMNTWARFQYHPLPTLSVSFSGMDETATCTSRQRSFLIIESQSRTNATIRLSEDYPSGLTPPIQSCTNIQGQINITNSLGEDSEISPLLSVCRTTCPMDVVMDAKITASYTNVCAVNIPDDESASLACPINGVIESVTFTNYGMNSTGLCSRTFSASGCKSAKSTVVVTRACVGRNNCTIAVKPTKFGPNPCPNAPVNYFTAQVLCRIETPTYENAKVQLLMQVGYPNRISPFFKNFVARMNVKGYIDDILIVSEQISAAPLRLLSFSFFVDHQRACYWFEMDQRFIFSSIPAVCTTHGAA